jgi:hypothetical protein
MKNTLAENLLRFGVKNLSESDTNSIKTILTEEEIQTTDSNGKKVKLESSTALFSGPGGEVGITLTYDAKGNFTGDRKKFTNYIERIQLQFYGRDIKKYIFPWMADTAISKVQVIVNNITITDPGYCYDISVRDEYGTSPGDEDGGKTKVSWIQSIVTKTPFTIFSFKDTNSLASGYVDLNCRIQNYEPSDYQLKNLKKRGVSATIQKYKGLVTISGVFRYPGQTKKDYEATTNANPNMTPEQKASRIADWNKKNPTGVSPNRDIPWSVPVTRNGVAVGFPKAATTTP